MLRLALRLAFALLALAAPLRAQRLAPASALARPAAVRPASWRLPAAASERPSAWPYVALGAAVGALATAGGIALAVAHDDAECICSPLAFAPVVVGGAALGAGGGYLIYRLRF